MISLKNTLKAITKALSVDYIVEQGTSGIWTYRKWNSGIAECWGTEKKTATVTYQEFIMSYPSGLFSETPLIVTSGGALGRPNAYGVYANAYTKEAADLYVYTAGSSPAWIYMYVIGRWK